MDKEIVENLKNIIRKGESLKDIKTVEEKMFLFGYLSNYMVSKGEIKRFQTYDKVLIHKVPNTEVKTFQDVEKHYYQLLNKYAHKIDVEDKLFKEISLLILEMLESYDCKEKITKEQEKYFISGAILSL